MGWKHRLHVKNYFLGTRTPFLAAPHQFALAHRARERCGEERCAHEHMRTLRSGAVLTLLRATRSRIPSLSRAHARVVPVPVSRLPFFNLVLDAARVFPRRVFPRSSPLSRLAAALTPSTCVLIRRVLPPCSSGRVLPPGFFRPCSSGRVLPPAFFSLAQTFADRTACTCATTATDGAGRVKARPRGRAAGDQALAVASATALVAAALRSATASAADALPAATRVRPPHAPARPRETPGLFC